MDQEELPKVPQWWIVGFILESFARHDGNWDSSIKIVSCSWIWAKKKIKERKTLHYPPGGLLLSTPKTHTFDLMSLCLGFLNVPHGPKIRQSEGRRHGGKIKRIKYTPYFFLRSTIPWISYLIFWIYDGTCGGKKMCNQMRVDFVVHLHFPLERKKVVSKKCY